MSGENGNSYQFNSFRLNVSEQQLFKGNETVQLTPKAFNFLAVLVERAGHVVGKEELLQLVWPDSFVEEANLSRTVHMLRRALEENETGDKFIETVSKRGYRFVAQVSTASNNFRSASHSAAINASSNGSESRDRLDGTPRLIGRGEEIAQIQRLLLQPTTRLVTMTGVGGIGKTTLAQEVARIAEDIFPDGVHFIDLSSVSKPENVGTTIASAFGISEATADDTFEVLKNTLRSRRTLIVLDNFEQVVSASSQIADLIAASDNLKVLVTSRILLHLQKEHEFVVPPLSVPSNLKIIDECLRADAVQLFVERARSAKASFLLSSENASDVAKICVRLEGLPLAIELAAAWVKILSPRLILEKLGSHLKLLTRGSTDLPKRQQTVRATVEWSFNLLAASEKDFFQKLAVFSGGFTIEDAEGVISGIPEPISVNARCSTASPDIIDVLDGTRSLVEQSLLLVKELADGSSRFRMLEVVREFALEMLALRQDKENVRRRHAEYFLQIAEEAELQSADGPQPYWIERLEQNHDNFKASLDWFSEHDAESELRVCAALCDFWLVRDHYLEGLNRLKSALKSNSELASPTRLRVIRGAGQICFRLGDTTAAHDFFTQGIQACKRANDKREEALMGIGAGSISSGV